MEQGTVDLRADPARDTPIGIHHIQLPKRGERDLAAVRREGHVADLARAEGRRVMDRVIEVEAGPRVDGHVGGEGDLGGIVAVERDAPEAAAVRSDERGAVGRERVAGEEVEGRAALHVVALHGVDEPAFVAGGQVAGAQAGGVLVAGAVDEGCAVGGNGRAEPRPVAAGDRGLPTRLAVVAEELVLRERRVVGPVARALGQVDVTARGVERGSDGLELLGLVDQGDPAAAVAVKEPRLRGAAERAEGAGRDQVLSVRRPVGRGVEVVVAAGDLGGVGAVGAQDPQVLAAAPVRDEDDLASVGAEARLAFEGGAGQERGRGAAFHGEGVEVAEEVEDEGRAVRADVDRDPGALAGGEADLAGGFEWEGLGGEGVGRRGVVLRLGGGGREGRDGDEAEDGQRGPSERRDGLWRVTLHFRFTPRYCSVGAGPAPEAPFRIQPEKSGDWSSGPCGGQVPS